MATLNLNSFDIDDCIKELIQVAFKTYPTLSVKEYAKLLNTTERTLFRWKAKYKIEFPKDYKKIHKMIEYLEEMGYDIKLKER